MPGFLDGLDADIANSLLRRFRNMWIYGTAEPDQISFPAGETSFLSGIGMTVTGMKLEEHQKIAGLGAAVDMILDMASHPCLLCEQDLFVLHRTLKGICDQDDEPVGAWKTETNGTWTVQEGKRKIFCEYALPQDIPGLMGKWIDLLNHLNRITRSHDEAVFAYAALHVSFVRIHPFCDGNGRIARFLANLPVMEAGFPPILIPEEKRKEYIRVLAGYKQETGCPHRNSCLLPCNEYLNVFVSFCHCVWKESFALVRMASERQAERNRQKQNYPDWRMLKAAVSMG